MQKFGKIAAGTGLAIYLACATISTAGATTAVVYGAIDPATAAFNAAVIGAGATSVADVVTTFNGATYNGAGYTVVQAGGGSLNAAPYTINSSSPSRTLTGSAFDISPSGSGTGHGDGNGIGSGILFNFATPINAIGFEVGDWATCCQVSNLYISFDGGTAIRVGSSQTFGDQFLTNGGAGVFVSALDDTAMFTTVNFWGDGYGEFLVAGGTIRTAAITIDSLPTTVPEPASMALLGAGCVVMGVIRRKREQPNTKTSLA